MAVGRACWLLRAMRQADPLSAWVFKRHRQPRNRDVVLLSMPWQAKGNRTHHAGQCHKWLKTLTNERGLTQKSAKKRTFGAISFFFKSYIDHERFRLNPLFLLIIKERKFDFLKNNVDAGINMTVRAKTHSFSWTDTKRQWHKTLFSNFYESFIIWMGNDCPHLFCATIPSLSSTTYSTRSFPQSSKERSDSSSLAFPGLLYISWIRDSSSSKAPENVIISRV